MDIKVRLADNGKIEESNVYGGLTSEGFSLLSTSEMEGKTVSVFRNQTAKGLDVAQLRQKIADAGGEVLEVA